MSTNPPGLDLDRLASYLNNAGLTGGALSAEVIAGGKSNLTYVLYERSVPETENTTAGGVGWVLRRPPLGHVLPTAHNMAREFRVLSALADTAVPVPRTLVMCDDADVIGAPFYVMSRVPGTVYRTLDDTRHLAPATAARITSSLVDALAELHMLDPGSVGLRDFGRPAGFLQRQLKRWHAQLDASRSRPLAGIDELHDRLAASVPASPRPAIIHGDYRLDNAIVAPDASIAAVVDWEMTTVGDPLTDLGLLLAYWDGLSDSPGSVSEAVGPASPFPRGSAFVDEYAVRRSDIDLENLPWYTAFAYFKLAVITEGIHFRYVHGQTVGEGFDRIGEHVPMLITLGHEQLAD